MKSIFIILIFGLLSNPFFSQNKFYIETNKAIEDIEFMIKTIEKVHYNPYFNVNKKQFDKAKQELIKGFDKDSITYVQFLATGMKLAAQLSGGHTQMSWQNRQIISELKVAYFIPFKGKLINNNQQFVVTSSKMEGLFEGDIIESINGINCIELYKECMSFVGGIETYKSSVCEQLFPIYIYFTEKISSPFLLKIKERDLTIKGLDLRELGVFLNQDLHKQKYTFEILEDSIGLISYNSCQDLEAFKLFLDETFVTLTAKNITKLIIDIRENGGGDSKLNDVLLAYITKKTYRQSSGRYWKVSEHAKTKYKENNFEEYFGKEFMDSYLKAKNDSIIETLDEELITPMTPINYFSGTTCFLIGTNTFSSANFLADAIKTYELSTLIGLPTGEYTNDFGEVLTFTLSNSGSNFYVSSTYDIGANGNSKLMQPVFPDIKVEENTLEFAIDWIKK